MSRQGLVGALCAGVVLLVASAPAASLQSGPTWQDVPEPGQRRISPSADPDAPPSTLPSAAFGALTNGPNISGDHLVIIDMDDDGDLDLVVGRDKPGGVLVVVFLGDGTGVYTWSDSTLFTDGFSASLIRMGDLDGDALPDAVVGTFDGFVVGLRDGAGFMGSTVYLGSRPDVLVDIDGDSHLDVVGGGFYWPNDGTGSLGTEKSMPSGLLYEDMDTDGTIDVVEVDPEGYPGLEAVFVSHGNGGGTFDPFTEFYVALAEQHAFGSFAGDQDQDGYLEVYLPSDREWRQGEHIYTVEIVENDATGRHQESIEFDELPATGWVRDLDFDGDQDVVILESDVIYVREALDDGFLFTGFGAPFEEFRSPVLADFNGDGLDDVVDINDSRIVYAPGVGVNTDPGTIDLDVGADDICVDVFRSGDGGFTGESAVSGNSGSVTFNVPPGQYDLFAWDCSFENAGQLVRQPYAWKTIRSNDGSQSGDGVTVAAGSTTTVDGGLELGSIYTGTVTDIRSGAPVARITVTFDTPEFSGTETDDSGQWTWVGIPSGIIPTFTADDLEGFYFETDFAGPTSAVGAVFAGTDVAMDGRLVDARDIIFAQDVIWIADQGITKGCEKTGYLYCPGDSISRGQMAAFLVRTLGLTDIDPAVSFDDIDGNIFEQDILKLATAGITSGCAGGTSYCPGDPVKRGQMAAFLVRAFDLDELDPSISFDDTGSSIFEQDILRLATAEVTFGCNSDGTLYCPGKEVTRAQMAAFLRRAVEGS